MKKFFIALLVLLLLAVVACVPFLLHLDKYRASIAAGLSQKLGHKVVIGKLEAALVPPALILKDVSLLNPAGDAPLLQAQQIIAPISFPALFKGSIAPQSLTIRNWVTYVRRNKDGSWAWDEWLVPAAKLTQSGGYPIQSITLDRGEAHAVDPYGPSTDDFVVQVLQGSWERAKTYVSINGVLPSLPAPVSFLFQSNGSLVSNPQWTGVLALSDENRQGKFDIKVANGRMEATGHSDAWRFDTAYAFARFYTRMPVSPPVASPAALLQNWESHFDWQGSTLSFTQSAQVAGGRSEANGSVSFKPGLSSGHLDLALQDAKIQPIESTLFGSSPLEGTATLLARFDLVLSSSPWDMLKGQGAVELKDGKYFLPDASTRGLSKAHTMKYLLKKYPGFLGGGLAYSKATAHWQLHKGVLYFDDGFVNLGDIKLAAVGGYDVPRHGLDAHVRVQVNEKNPALLKELPPSYVYKGENGTQIQPMNGRLQGTPSEWHLTAAKGSKVPQAVASKLSKAIRSK